MIHEPEGLIRWFSKSTAALIQIVVLCFAAGSFFQCHMESNAVGQRRGRSAQGPPRASIDYSKFSHASEKHRQSCSSCHKIPTQNWQSIRAFPDVADYPDHDACVSCHRAQFFRGARPVICTICHTQSSPRGEVRLAFRKPSASRQFFIEFPHDRHQDVIARRFYSNDHPEVFRRISFGYQQPADSYNNCTICHEARGPIVSSALVQWPDGFVPDALTFKNVPTSHGSCFNCHWKAQEPVSQQCEGCHKLTPSPISVEVLPTRISLKFRHDGGGERKNHVAECTSCHINITKSATVRGLKPDVPITACTECHNKDGLRLDVSGELAQVDKNREFVCVYCHTSNVGRLDPPVGHYVIAGREPLKRKDLK